MNAWTRFLSTVDTKPDRVALIQGDRQVTFIELENRTRIIANSMMEVGVRSGDCCIAWGDNSIDMAAIIPAIWSLGAVPVSLGGGAPIAYLERVCRMTSASCVIAFPADQEPGLTGLDCPIIGCNIPDPEQLPDPIRPMRGGYAEPHQPASIVLTSGSTGMPKGVFQTHETLIERCEAVARFLEYRDEDRLLCPVPWDHDYGWGQLLSVYFLGTQMILPEMSGPVGVSHAIGGCRPTIIGGVPSLYTALVRSPTPIREVDRSSVRLLTSTGSNFPKAIQNEISELFGKAGIALNYGLTETYRSTGLKPDEREKRPGSVGRAIEGVHISILREDGAEALRGEVGQVVHHGAGVFGGYWNDEAGTDRVRRKSGLSSDGREIYQVMTGDTGWLDEEGYLFLQGRRDRIVKTMDVRVCLDEVETSLLECKEVAEVAVFDVPHEIMGTMVVAALVMKKGGHQEDLTIRKHARSCLQKAMRPRAYHILERLPRTSSGKADYTSLRALFAPKRSNG